MDLMWFLMLAHLIGDYALQSDAMACKKRNSLKTLTEHAVIYVVTLAAVLWAYARVTHLFAFWTAHALLPLAAIFVIHWIQDLIKGHYLSESHQVYYQDQALHLIQLFLLRWWIV